MAVQDGERSLVYGAETGSLQQQRQHHRQVRMRCMPIPRRQQPGGEFAVPTGPPQRSPVGGHVDEPSAPAPARTSSRQRGPRKPRPRAGLRREPPPEPGLRSTPGRRRPDRCCRRSLRHVPAGPPPHRSPAAASQLRSPPRVRARRERPPTRRAPPGGGRPGRETLPGVAGSRPTRPRSPRPTSLRTLPHGSSRDVGRSTNPWRWAWIIPA